MKELIVGAYYRNGETGDMGRGPLIGPMIKTDKDFYPLYPFAAKGNLYTWNGRFKHGKKSKYDLDSDHPLNEDGTPLESGISFSGESKKVVDEFVKKTDFDSILLQRLEKIKTVLGNKAKEYSHEGDRFFNFRQAAKDLPSGCPKQALYGMMLKHWVSVQDLVFGRLDASLADEKIGDMINYLILLEGLIKLPESDDVANDWGIF